MDRVLDRLFVGGNRDLSVPLKSLGFSAVVDLRDRVSGASTRADEEPLDLPVHRLRNRDGDPWTPQEILSALDFIHEHVRWGKVLLACGAGMSRSACLTIGYLVRCGWDTASAHAQVERARPQITPSSAMLEAVLAAIADVEQTATHETTTPLRPEAA